MGEVTKEFYSLEKNGLRSHERFNWENLSLKSSSGSGLGRNAHARFNESVVIHVAEKGYKTKKGGELRPTFAIYIGSSVVERSRWIGGDRVVVLYDKNLKILLIKRVTSGGHCAQKEGKGRLKIALTYRDGFPEIKGAIACSVLEPAHPLWSEGIPVKISDYIKVQ